MILSWIIKSLLSFPPFPCSRVIESMALRVRGWTDLLYVCCDQQTLALLHIIRLQVGLAASGRGCRSDHSLGKAQQEAAWSASLTASPPFLSVLIWFSFFQRLELENENPRYLWNVCPAIVIPCLVCPSSSLACRSQVDRRTFCSVESPTTERKESQVFPNLLPGLYQQPYTKKH